MVLGDLAEFTHFVTRVKIVPALADDLSLTEAERTRGRAFAAKLSMRVLARTWQMLLKGIEEVAAPARPLAAAEMILVRIAYAADLPTPDEVIRSLGESGARQRRVRRRRPVSRRRVRNRRRAPRPSARGLAARRFLARAARAAAPAELPATETVARGDRDQRAAPVRLRASKNWSRSPRRSATSASRARSNATYGWCASKTAGWKSRSKRARRKR